ncbi:MAG: beta-propeller domain-containing protein [Nanoarchaeota archaeon]|nr:beta-propeller domain-containing protein [Nanoarchaeota archaeon]
MDEKFILMGLNDENSKAVAEVLGNKTCKRILDHLADVREASEKDISVGLKMPINTAEYNLKKLIKASLVEKSKNFFWSVKGKRIPMYKLARKHIIISPNKNPSLSYLKSILPVVAVVAIFVLIAGLSLQHQGTIDSGNGFGLNKFGSIGEMKEFLKQNLGTNSYYGGMEKSFATDGVVGATTAESGAQAASDYSETNVQVEGVDEPDIVKNDGKYIYTLSGEKVVIVDAYPAEDMRVLSQIEFESDVRDIFINGDKLVVFGESREYFDTGLRCPESFDIWTDCGGYSTEETKVYIYDVSDREEPELEDEISVSGRYVEARMIGDYVYIVSSESVYLNHFDLPSYEVRGLKRDVAVEDVYYFNTGDESYVFNTVSAINLGDGEIDSETYLLGASRTVYVSESNIYLTYQKRISQENYLERYVEEVLEEVLPGEIYEQVLEELDSSGLAWEKRRAIDEIVGKYISSLDGDENSDFAEKFQKALEEFSIVIQKETEKTVVHKIEIDEGEINYVASGEVPGSVLNQFSMDEFDGNFRIATTVGQVSRDSAGGSLNNLYVLDEELEIIGSVEDLAEGERIYSARLMGERAYLVTFKKVDPLFVIDLSNPREPEVLGYLKITGYSDYLHPYDENHVIGIGKETAGGGEHFSWYQGIKISLFDVSDVANPKEVAKIEIGDRGTDSYALRDHRAFLFDRERELLVIPIALAEIDESQYDGEIPDNAYGERVWQGAYVLNINEDEISVRGKITHNSEDYETDRWSYTWDQEIQRSLWMDDVLYTISERKVMANELGSLEEIGEVLVG